MARLLKTKEVFILPSKPLFTKDPYQVAIYKCFAADGYVRMASLLYNADSHRKAGDPYFIEKAAEVFARSTATTHQEVKQELCTKVMNCPLKDPFSHYAQDIFVDAFQRCVRELN